MTKDKDSAEGHGRSGLTGVHLDQRVTSHNQSGGITAHTVNMAPLERQLDARSRTQLTQLIPRDRTVEVDALFGDGEALAFAQQIWDFLSAEGFTMSRGVDQVAWSSPVAGQSLDLESDPAVARLIIGRRS